MILLRVCLEVTVPPNGFCRLKADGCLIYKPVRPPPDPGPIRLVNSTYKVRGDFVTTQQLLVFSRIDGRECKQMKTPSPPNSERHVHTIQSALLTWATQEEKLLCVCVRVFAQAQKSLCRPTAPQVNDIICPTVGPQRVRIRHVCVDVLCMRVYIIYNHFSHEKQAKTHKCHFNW